jgi:hypothetical protein
LHEPDVLIHGTVGRWNLLRESPEVQTPYKLETLFAGERFQEGYHDIIAGNCVVNIEGMGANEMQSSINSGMLVNVENCVPE